jgi:4-hydroxy-2-oxoheptanedioate aldolase
VTDRPFPARSWSLQETTAELQTAWAAGRPTYGGWISIGHSYSAQLVGRAGLAWVGIDAQHGSVAEADLPDLLQAIATTHTPAFVRVAWPAPDAIMRSLDAGANGVIVPMINSPAEAEAAVSACYYPPHGIRSWGPNRAALAVPSYGPAVGNESTLCILMIETVDACERIDEILAVPGIDAVFAGPGDLALTHGFEQSFEDERLAAKLLEIRDACRRAGVVAGIYAGAPAEARRWAAEGFQLIALYSDSDLVVLGAQQLVAELGQ